MMEQNHYTPKKSNNLSFSISNILSTTEVASDQNSSSKEDSDNSDLGSESGIVEKSEDVKGRQSPEEEGFLPSSSSGLQPSSIISHDFSPWLYRPMPLHGYMPMQTSFLASKFAGLTDIVCYQH